MSTRIPDPATAYFDVADPAFSVTSAEVRPGGSVTRVPRERQPGFLIAGIPGPFGSQSPLPPTSRPGFTEMNGSDAEGYSGCSCHRCRLLACCRTRRRHLGM